MSGDDWQMICILLVYGLSFGMLGWFAAQIAASKRIKTEREQAYNHGYVKGYDDGYSEGVADRKVINGNSNGISVADWIKANTYYDVPEETNHTNNVAYIPNTRGENHDK